jgi:hypothetical protein
VARHGPHHTGDVDDPSRIFAQARCHAWPAERRTSPERHDGQARGRLARWPGTQHHDALARARGAEGVGQNEMPGRIARASWERGREESGGPAQIISTLERLRRRRAASDAFLRRFTEGFM